MHIYLYISAVLFFILIPILFALLLWAIYDRKIRHIYIFGTFKLYIDTAVQKGFDKEIFMDVNLHHYPLRDYCCLWNELQTTVKSYAKAGKRNEKAAAHKKIAKHSMHLLRLYMMCIDILEKQKIVTYREKEHDLLMDIRNGKYLGADDKPLPEFFEMVNKYEKKLEYAKKNTTLPDGLITGESWNSPHM